MLPNRYTEFEGGDWQPWTAGIVSDASLGKRASDVVTINNVQVHSLITSSGLRWDCIHGRSSLPLRDNDASRGVI